MAHRILIGALAMYNNLEYPPFGIPYAQADRTATSLYDARCWEYGIQGRWPSPDPAGIAAANPANPQSWNRYAYMLNNPLLC